MLERKRLMINEALRLLRLYYGFSQVELADEVGLSQSMISEIERGTKQVSIETLERYSSKLGVRMSQLMFFAEELENQPVQKRGKLIVASNVLKILEALAPRDHSNAKATS